MDILQTIDSLQNAVLEEELKKKKSNKPPEYDFDHLKMYFGEDCNFHGIDISIPKIGEILKIGEMKFYRALSPFLNNPTSVRVMLYDNFNHKDWTKTKDIEVFYLLMCMVEDKTPLKLFFKNFHFNDIKIIQLDEKSSEEDDSNNNSTLAVLSPSQKIVLTETQLMEIIEYIREIMNVHPKVEKGKGKATKLSMIQEDRIKAIQEQEKKNNSTLLPLISACVNHPGFKYKLEELRDVNIYQFMDSVSRIPKYEQSVAAIHGALCGMVSGKDVKDLFNFMGE